MTDNLAIERELILAYCGPPREDLSATPFYDLALCYGDFPATDTFFWVCHYVKSPRDTRLLGWCLREKSVLIEGWIPLTFEQLLAKLSEPEFRRKYDLPPLDISLTQS